MSHRTPRKKPSYTPPDPDSFLMWLCISIAVIALVVIVASWFLK